MRLESCTQSRDIRIKFRFFTHQAQPIPSLQETVTDTGENQKCPADCPVDTHCREACREDMREDPENVRTTNHPADFISRF